jgi:polar amino acid transport system substrate-binding protein
MIPLPPAGRCGRCIIAAALAAAAFIAAPALARREATPPKLYTEQQAEDGQAIYVGACASCHGDKLQGNSAPASGGKALLHKAQKLGWSVSDMRTLVVSSMPLNDPGSLSPKQYAQVLAFLLASDCYPAGNTPFPTKDTAKLKHTPLKPPPNAEPSDADLGTCSVK